MGANSSSNHNQAHAQDLLSSLSEQNIQSIALFLDLRSLKNLQLTNRRMRQLFETSLWNRLFIITFNPNRNENEEENAVLRPQRVRYTYAMFRTQWFERYPQELIELQNRMRTLRLEERRRQQALERERRAQIEKGIKSRKKTIDRYIDLYNISGLLERVILFGLCVFIW